MKIGDQEINFKLLVVSIVIVTGIVLIDKRMNASRESREPAQVNGMR